MSHAAGGDAWVDGDLDCYRYHFPNFVLPKDPIDIG